MSIKALHRTAIPLRSIAAGELGRSANGRTQLWHNGRMTVQDCPA